jgi:hypothetical protein
VALDLGGGQVPLTLVAEDLPEMLAAAFVFFVVNHVLAGAGVAFLNGVRVLPFLRTDLDFLSWTAGFQLALAPLLLGAPGALMALGPSPCWPSTSAAARRPRRPIRRRTTRSRGLPNRPLLLARSPTPWVAAAPARGRGWPWWISTTSSRSTTRSATMPATSCCSASPSG